MKVKALWGIILVGVGLIFWLWAWWFATRQNAMVFIGIPINVTVVGVLVGTFTLWAFISLREKIFGDIEKLPYETILFYYKELLSTFKLAVVGLGVAFSILWGFVTAPVGHRVLQEQSILLLLFLIYIGVSMGLTIFKEFKEQIAIEKRK